MATIKDVAKMAGVSTTTVSHVMNKTRFVAKETEKSVLEAIKTLNYSPNAVARSLKVNTTKSIGMIVTTSQAPYFAEVIQSVEEYCYRQGYSLFLCNTQNDEMKIQNYLEMLAKKRVDGLLVMCSEYSNVSQGIIRNFTGIPKVVMDWNNRVSDECDILLDNGKMGGYLATKYFIESGHREIGIITGMLSKDISRSRLQGFYQAMEEANLVVREEWVKEGLFEPEDGYEMMMTMLNGETYPTAVFCCNDMMALGAMSAINEKGLRVPDDISIIGYDDIHASRFFSPPLTTICQPKKHLGEQAVIRLFEQINHQDTTRQIITLTPTLVERKSVRKLV